MNSSELIQRLLLSLLGIYLTGKFVAPLLREFFSRGPKSSFKDDMDLDYLINKKKMMMTSGQSGSIQESSSEKKTLLSAYQGHEDLKKITLLVKEKEWGASQVSTDLKNLLQRNHNLSVTKEEAHQSLMTFLKYNEEILIDIPFTYREIIQITATHIFLSKLHQGDRSSLQFLSRKLNCRIEDAQFASKFLLRTILKGEVFKKELTTFENIALVAWKDEKLPLTIESRKLEIIMLVERVAPWIVQIESLSPIEECPKEKSQQMKWARDVLRLNSSDDKDKIKKSYKAMVQKRHPDKMISKKWAKNHQSVINENFSKIQRAYELLK